MVNAKNNIQLNWFPLKSFQSSNPPFTSVELDHSDSGREGCTVTTLTITAEPKNWQDAIRVAVQEVLFLIFVYKLILPFCMFSYTKSIMSGR